MDEGRAYAPDARLAVTAVTGQPYSSWCTTCKAYTLVVTPLYLLTHSGVCVKTLSQCGVCDDVD